MKNFTYSLMIAYLEDQTSEQESKEIQAYIARYPYYEDILCGLKQLLAASSKEEVAAHMRQRKEAARQQLFNKKIVTA